MAAAARVITPDLPGFGRSPRLAEPSIPAMAARRDSKPLLASIACPTLVMAGSEERVIPIAESEAMAKAIPGARLEVVPEPGHLVNLEQPELFQIKKLSGLWASGGDERSVMLPGGGASCGHEPQQIHLHQDGPLPLVGVMLSRRHVMLLPGLLRLKPALRFLKLLAKERQRPLLFGECSRLLAHGRRQADERLPELLLILELAAHPLKLAFQPLRLRLAAARLLRQLLLEAGLFLLGALQLLL